MDNSSTRTADAGDTAHPEGEPIGGFPLFGPSLRPDPLTHAYRTDLADVALAGVVIASHYAEPLNRVLKCPADLLEAPDSNTVLASLAAGDTMQMLDCMRGWAWGYAGPDRLVGYVTFSAL